MAHSLWDTPSGAKDCSHSHPMPSRPNPRSQTHGHLLRPLALGEPRPPEQQRPAEGQPPAGFLQGALALLLGQRLGHHPQAVGCGPPRGRAEEGHVP